MRDRWAARQGRRALVRPLVLLIVSTLGFVCRPAAAEWLLAASQIRPVPGETFTVAVVRDEPPSTGPMPDSLAAELETREGKVAVVLLARPADGSAYRRDYAFQWPAGLVGTAVLRLVDRSASPLMLAAEALPADVGEAMRRSKAVAAAPPPAPTREPALGFNEPMYFVFGANGGASARFQLSFRYRLFDAGGSVVDLLPFTSGLNFAYTQTSLWDLAGESKPFRDTSYRPSLFYEWKFPVGPDPYNTLALQGGYEHESNGRDGPSSRSIDMAFARAAWRLRLPDGHTELGIAPKAWIYLDRKENPDIPRYRGYGELGLRFGRDDGWLATLKLRRAEGGRGSTQLDLSYPLGRPILSDVGAFLHFQYFDGYGETLLDYDKSRHPQLRIGFSIVR